MYTSIDRVRTLSGFDDNTNISNELIKTKIIIASGYIDSAIGYIYSLPIRYHYDSSILFSGTATSGGTLAIVINGTTYNVTVTSGDTANTVADNFRIACEDSADFITDSLGFGTTVLLISKTTSVTASTAYAEVNVTSAPDSFGLKTKVGVRSKRYPVVLEQIAAEIATSLLFIDVYGVEAQDTGKDGKSRMEIINETLQKLQGGHESGQSIRIFDEVSSTEISLTTGNSAVSYPNDTSETDTTDPTSPKIWMNKVF